VVRYVESVAATAEMIPLVPFQYPVGGGETALELAGDVGEAGVGAKLDDHVVVGKIKSPCQPALLSPSWSDRRW